jgi:hypothetical protein
VIVSILLLCVIVLGTYIASHRLNGMQLLAALTFLATGLLLVIFPSAATWVAVRLNVGRGTDLITYLAIVGGLFVAANFYFRFKRQEQQIATVVRELAIRDAVRTGSPSA